MEGAIDHSGVVQLLGERPEAAYYYPGAEAWRKRPPCQPPMIANNRRNRTSELGWNRQNGRPAIPITVELL